MLHGSLRYLSVDLSPSLATTQGQDLIFALGFGFLWLQLCISLTG